MGTTGCHSSLSDISDSDTMLQSVPEWEHKANLKVVRLEPRSVVKCVVHPVRPSGRTDTQLYIADYQYYSSTCIFLLPLLKYIFIRMCCSHDLVFVYFQDYRVLNLLGKGGFACVYRAKAIKTGLEVAIKMVRCVLRLICMRTKHYQVGNHEMHGSIHLFILYINLNVFLSQFCYSIIKYIHCTLPIGKYM